MAETREDRSLATPSGAREKAEALLDGLLSALVANQRAAESAGPQAKRARDVGRQRLAEHAAEVQRLIEQLKSQSNRADENSVKKT